MSTTTDNSAMTQRFLVKLCNDRLADAIDLQLQCKHAYWNTTEPNLMTLRKEFHDLSDWLDEHIDRIAERVVEAGGVANSTLRVEETWSHVLCAPNVFCRNHAETIAKSLVAFREMVGKAVTSATEVNDLKTIAVFSPISSGIDRWHNTITTHSN